ncbi:aminotransferase family protein [Pseudonocardia humida]|uniref:Aspartate aminotransferase family protein n=1 Tax=Pseudonocardia humida TaxID=2800819 RepID=A0ABT0ZZQ1_9PSEU|nr:aminotransferase class III-fold pyridoxal phosphate-dependent enzyme [Pseudonocardia humida]MCO1656201.1 aspartate aminotransferase family protein [Pseudonocardia humida]
MATSSFWHSFADMQAITRDGPLVLERGEGVHVWDTTGRRYVDAAAGLWNCNVGHGRTEIGEAVARQVGRLASFSTFGDYSNPPAEELAERLAALAPFPAARAFLTSGGSDSVDTAVKLVRRYWSALGQPERRTVVSRESAYHGMHLGGTGLAGIEPNRAGYGELVPDTTRVPWDSAEALAKTIESLGEQHVAAFICEPVIGAGGILIPPPDYLAEVARICRETGVLLVLDEVITGFGRVGEWFAAHRFGVEPDLVLCAKGITSGYLPMGAVLAGERVSEPFYDGTVGLWRHGYTSSGHVAGSAAALANLDIIERERLIPRVRDAEVVLAEAFTPLAAHPLVGEVRTGTGLLTAVQLSTDALARDPALPAAVVAALRAEGVLTRAIGQGAVQVSPAFVITDEQIRDLAAAFATALDTALTAAPA